VIVASLESRDFAGVWLSQSPAERVVPNDHFSARRTGWLEPELSGALLQSLGQPLEPFEGSITLFVKDKQHLEALVRKLKKVKGVMSVRRTDSA